MNIHGIEYVVEKRESTDEIAAEYPNTARVMKEHGIAERLLLRRPEGTILCETYRYESGKFGTPISTGARV